MFMHGAKSTGFLFHMKIYKNENSTITYSDFTGLYIFNANKLGVIAIYETINP